MGNGCFKPLPEAEDSEHEVFFMPEDELYTATLPQEIIREILLRLTIRSSITCKCVCKLWRHIIETSYTPKQGLAFTLQPHDFKVYDEAFRPLLRVSLLCPQRICSSIRYDYCNVIDSANGVLLLWYRRANNLFVCNPMTSEYAVLPPPPIHESSDAAIFGFGVSKISGQYKILCGTYELRSWSWSWSFYVYTLGGRGGLWRSILVPELVRDGSYIQLRHTERVQVAPFFNGNLHCLKSDLEKNLLMCCFDLETEVFTSFSRFSLSFPDILKCSHLRILEDQLCLCLSDASVGSRIVIWRMNTYGDTNSWNQEYTFNNLPHKCGFVYPLKVLANGDLLFAVELHEELFIYSRNTKTIVTQGLVEGYSMLHCNISFYTPNFLSLKRLGIDNVKSLKDNIFSDS